MTVLLDNLAGLLATAAFVAVVAWAVDRHAERRSWAEETNTWHGADITDLPRRDPITRPDHDTQVDAPADDTLDRVLAGLRNLDHDPVDDEYQGVHRYETAAGCATQKAALRALREPTGEFDAIVAYGWDTDERRVLTGADVPSVPTRTAPATPLLGRPPRPTDRGSIGPAGVPGPLSGVDDRQPEVSR